MDSEEKFQSMLDALYQADVIAVDTETDGVKHSESKLVGIVFGICVDPDVDLYHSWYLPFGHQPSLFGDPDNLPPEYLRQVGELLALQDKIFVFHNAKYDFRVLENTDLPIPAIWYDTMLMFHMWNENFFSYGLKQLGVQFLPEEAESDKESKVLKKLHESVGGTGFERIPPDGLSVYACKDAMLTVRLFQMIWKAIQDSDIAEVFDDLWVKQQQYSEALRQVEARGVLIDLQRAKALGQQARRRQAELRAGLGFDPLKPKHLAQKLFSAPPGGLGFQVGPRGKPSKSFPDGKPTMDADFLSTLSHPIVDDVLEYRKLDKEASTWFEGWPNVADELGRLHPTYKIHGTVTTRLSCSEPNMQQVPRDEERSEVKSLLKASKGFELWEFDYSQVELRLACMYGADENMINTFRTGGDIHQLTADQLSIDRQSAKTINFAIIYDVGAKGLSRLLGIREAEARRLLARFRRVYPGIAKAAASAEATAQRLSSVPMWTGRRRHFRYPSEYRKAFNSAVQGGGAEILKHSLITLVLETDEFTGHVVGLVHDSLWVELPTDDLERQMKIVKNVMEWPTDKFGLPFPVDYKRLA